MRRSRRDLNPEIAFARARVAERATKGASPVPFKAESVTNRTGQPHTEKKVVACRDSHAEWVAFWAHTKLCDSGCIEWCGAPVKGFGHGRLKIGGRAVRAHRHAYKLVYGDPPSDKLVCHHCDNPICVRPDHLFVGTNDDNMRDMVRKGRQKKGSALPFAKLTEDDVVAIRTRYGRVMDGLSKPNGVSMKTIAVEYGVTEATVRELIVGLTWKSVPFEPRPVRHRQPLFGGDTYDAAKDEARLTNALRRVLACLRSGGWWTLTELAASAECSEAGASARLRDIRNTLHYVVHAHRRVGGLWEYALHGAPHADPPRAA